MELDASERHRLFGAAWHAALALPAADPAGPQLRANLAGELAFSLRTYADADDTPTGRAKEAWAELSKWLGEFEARGVKCDTSAAGDQLSEARAAVAFARDEYDACLAELRGHHYAHHQHGGRADLVSKLWFGAHFAKAQRTKGRPLTVIEQKHIKYDPKNAPPASLGAINLPAFTAPPGVHWP